MRSMEKEREKEEKQGFGGVKMTVK